MSKNDKGLSAAGFGLRMLFALVLVFLTYNPSGYSYYHWLMQTFEVFDVLVVPAGILLVIGWVIYIRATLRSLGALGLILAFALFGSVLWVLISKGWLAVENVSVLSWIIEVILALVLAVGMSWSHIRRKISGQVDVEED